MKNNADCFHVLNPPFSSLHNTIYTIAARLNLGVTLELPHFVIVNNKLLSFTRP